VHNPLPFRRARAVKHRLAQQTRKPSEDAGLAQECAKENKDKRVCTRRFGTFTNRAYH
jgi:hypothetical protein